jgi:hypothetical protein
MEDFAFCVFCDCFISHVPDPDAAEQVCDDCSSDDWAEDDGQPSEYDEWQDYMGGDDWDHGQYDEF